MKYTIVDRNISNSCDMSTHCAKFLTRVAIKATMIAIALLNVAELLTSKKIGELFNFTRNYR